MEPRAAARQALVATAAVYLAFAALRQLSPEIAGFLLVAAFYFLPGWLLRERPELAAQDEVGPDSPVPPWRASGWKTALVAALIVLPIFFGVALIFYAKVCEGELGWMRPLLWLEEQTPWAGSLERFWGGQCRSYVGDDWLGGVWPKYFVLPAEWSAWAQRSAEAGIGAFAGAIFGALLDMAVGLFAVALPEEVFHRGFLMGALERAWPPRTRVLGVLLGRGALLSSLVFALGHLVAYAEPVRLATFFPALVFAWLWRRSGSLWAPALFHFASNLAMSVFLANLFSGRV